MMRISESKFLVGFLVLMFSGFVARAQSTEYQLGETGWEVSSAPEPGSDEAFIAEMRGLISNGRPTKARRELDKWIKANEFSGSEWMPEAYLLRGDAWTTRGNEYQALFDYEFVITKYPSSGAFARAVERELEIAIRYVNGLKRKNFGIRYDSGERTGEELLVRVQERLPGSLSAERAGIELADYYYRRRDMRASAEAYEIFLINFPRSEFASHALKRRIYSNIGRFKGPDYDASGLLEARLLIDDYVARFPADAERDGIDAGLKARIDESGAAQMLSVAKWYIRQFDDVSARFMLKRLQRRYPGTVAASRGLDIMESHGWVSTSGNGK